jgi:hypothetical protein
MASSDSTSGQGTGVEVVVGMIGTEEVKRLEVQAASPTVTLARPPDDHSPIRPIVQVF